MSKFLEDNVFNGSIVLFLIGVPITIFYVLTLNLNNIENLMTHLNKFQKGEEVILQIDTLLEFIREKENSYRSKSLLTSYLYNYEENCNLKECPLKKYVNSLENNNETIIYLLQHIETLFQSGISKFPSCVELRISFCYFLLNKINKRQKANIELSKADNYEPSFEQKFEIFSIRKMIEEDNLENSENEDHMDVMSNLNYKKYFSQCKTPI